MKNRRVKFVFALVVVVLALSLVMAGCSGSKPANKEEPKQQQQAKSDYPNKQIEIVVPFSAGGSADMLARATADVLSKKWNVPIIVNNKPGGAAVPGTRYALKEAQPDGYTVLMDVHTSSSMMIGAFANPPVALADRKYAGRIIVDPFVFAVKSDAPWKDFKEFTEWVKANPTELIYGTVGPGGPSRYAVCDWLQQNGVDPAKAKMVVTEGGSDSMTKLAGGHINLAVHTVAESYALAEAGKVKVLAVLADQRSPFMPNVPTAKEQGVIKDINVRWWGAIALPSGVPDTVLKKWESAVADLVKDPDFMAKAKNLHMNIDYLNSVDTTDFVQKEAAFYTDFATKLGMRK